MGYTAYLAKLAAGSSTSGPCIAYFVSDEKVYAYGGNADKGRVAAAVSDGYECGLEVLHGESVFNNEVPCRYARRLTGLRVQFSALARRQSAV